MESRRVVLLAAVLLALMWMPASVTAVVECTTVTALISACSNFVTYGSPDPMPGSPCCDAMVTLNSLAHSVEDRRSLCRCVMGLITIYNPNATSIATLPGFCGVSLGFTIEPNTDCN
ncbi:putative non-specific lipid-transfer protein 14 [Diospyros lotus]|uniref:putative non-specific lipid-transfer protein 14 n=1 Tax=Diospyros lotus TaxID=55363 RepID=UPI002250AEE0|nr:putative non-specific lipid-transfer protein 14 [Diospyros lotus]